MIGYLFSAGYAAAIFCVLLLTSELPDSASLGLFILFGGLVTSALYQWKYKKRPCCTKQDRFAAGCLSLLFLIMLSIEDICSGPCFDRIHSVWISYACKAVFLIILYQCMYELLKIYFTCRFAGRPLKLKTIGNTSVFYLTIPIAVCSLIYTFAAFPGLMGSDSTALWINTDKGIYSAWHPIAYSCLIKIAQITLGSPFLIIMLQTVLWIYASNLAIKLLNHYVCGQAACLYAGMNLLLVSNYKYLGVMLKDVLWNICLFIFALKLFEWMRHRSGRAAVGLILSGIGVALFRHAGDINVYITFLVLILYLKIKEGGHFLSGLIKSLAIIVVCKVILMDVLCMSAFHAEPNEPYVKYSVPLSMIGAVVSSCEIDEEDSAFLETIMPLEQWKSSYDKYWADTLSRTWGGIGQNIYKLNDTKTGIRVLLLNLKYVFTHPVVYFTAFFDMSSIIWEIATPIDGYEWVPIAVRNEEVELWENGEYRYLQIKPSFLTEPVNRLSKATHSQPVWNAVCWRGGIHIFALLAAGALLMKKKRHGELLALVPFFIMAALLFLSIPAQDPRYIQSLSMLSVFEVVYAAFIHEKESKTPQQ